MQDFRPNPKEPKEVRKSHLGHAGGHKGRHGGGGHGGTGMHDHELHGRKQGHKTRAGSVGNSSLKAAVSNVNAQHYGGGDNMKKVGRVAAVHEYDEED